MASLKVLKKPKTEEERYVALLVSGIAAQEDDDFEDVSEEVRSELTFGGA